MAGAVGGGDDDAIVAINITPMVDIMLVLLIIFMITANLVDKDAIKVELPEAATGEATEKTVLGLTISPDRLWYLNGTEITEDDLRTFIKGELANPEALEMSAIIAADKNVPHGDVIKMIDVIKQEGVFKFALNIDPPAGSPKAALQPE